jgi:hypothetical protein
MKRSPVVEDKEANGSPAPVDAVVLVGVVVGFISEVSCWKLDGSRSVGG